MQRHLNTAILSLASGRSYGQKTIHYFPWPTAVSRKVWFSKRLFVSAQPGLERASRKVLQTSTTGSRSSMSLLITMYELAATHISHHSPRATGPGCLCRSAGQQTPPYAHKDLPAEKAHRASQRAQHQAPWEQPQHVVVLGHEGVPRVLVCLPYHCQLQEEVLAAVGLPPGAQAEAHAVPLEQEGQPRSWEQSHWGGQQEGPLAEVVQVQGHGHRVGHSWLGPFRPQPGHGRQGPCPEALQGVGRPLRPWEGSWEAHPSRCGWV